MKQCNQKLKHVIKKWNNVIKKGNHVIKNWGNTLTWNFSCLELGGILLLGIFLAWNFLLGIFLLGIGGILLLGIFLAWNFLLGIFLAWNFLVGIFLAWNWGNTLTRNWGNTLPWNFSCLEIFARNFSHLELGEYFYLEFFLLGIGRILLVGIFHALNF